MVSLKLHWMEDEQEPLRQQAYDGLQALHALTQLLLRVERVFPLILQDVRYKLDENCLQFHGVMVI